MTPKEEIMMWGRSHTPQIAFTGTLKQNLHHPTDTGEVRKEWITPQIIQKTVKEFMDRSSRAILSRKIVRQGQTLFYFGMIEGSLGSSSLKRLHIHLGISNVPLSIDFEEVKSILNKKWKAKPWAHTEISIKTTNDPNGWTDYCLKDFNPDNIDHLITNLVI